MDFNLPATNKDSPGDEETTPLDDETVNPDDEGDKAAMYEDNNNDKDPDV